MSIAEQVRTCTGCGRLLPLTEFRLRHRGGEDRHTRCRTCHNQTTCRAHAARRDRRVAQMLQQIADQERSAGAVTALVVGLLHQLGGIERFAQLVADHLRAAPPGSRRALVACRAIYRLVSISGALAAATPTAEPRQDGSHH